MHGKQNDLTGRTDRRSFLKKGLTAVGTATLSAGLLTDGLSVFGEGRGRSSAKSSLNKGDVAILKFLAAAELIESDLWLQYAELGGTQDDELPGLTGGSAPYMFALQQLDADMPQYIHDNTQDELSHAAFLNAYLMSRGEPPVNLDAFRNLPSSNATGAQGIGRLTNLMQLTVDTSWWTRYRSPFINPDLNPKFKFPQAVLSLSTGQFPAIPRSDDDLNPPNHIQAIANTAAFHFAFIEQGGSSLYPTLAQNVTDPEVLHILLSIGPTETSHFQTWHDKAGNAVQPPLAPLTDPTNPNLVFPNLNDPAFFDPETFQTNLIMPEPVPFLSPRLPPVSIIRPTTTLLNGAVAAINGFISDGLFIGQPKEFTNMLLGLAHAADAAVRGGM
ncbi:MAG TPA: ferritin-like domain-containing protein [Chthonomonadaceae bacterium]|nr:ferritin-like domain-containing protein [Chthonomonadaceae bacterium]